jgi:hypothetical protein
MFPTIQYLLNGNNSISGITKSDKHTNIITTNVNIKQVMIYIVLNLYDIDNNVRAITGGSNINVKCFK